MAASRGVGDQIHRPGSVATWPLVLIGLGIVLLISNFGWLSWSFFWRLGYLLPLTAIAVGADILLRGKYRLLVVAVTLVAAALLFASQSGAPGFAGLGQTTPVSESISQGLAGAERAEVRLQTGVAELRVTGGAGADLLAEGSVRPLRGERVDKTFAVVGRVARLTLESQGRVVGFSQPRAGLWELALSNAVPLALSVDTGVGEALLDLTQLRLSHLELNTGVGASTISLPPTGGYEANISTGVGAVTVRLPAGLPARINVSKGLGAVSIPAGFERNGDVYTSAGFTGASERVELWVSSGVGLVEIDLIE